MLTRARARVPTRLLAARTTIPVPKLIAYGINERFSPFRNFMIMEYVSGEKFTARKYEALSPTQLCRFYESLADIFIQLRRIELPAIGRPVMGRHGSISVLNPVMTIDMNMQGLKGMDPFHTMSRYNNGGPLHTARDYIEMLNDLLYNAFHLGYRTAGTNKEEKCILYNLHAVREFSEEWLKPSDSTEPFVLVHGDFEPFNLIVNHEGTITGVLDWEWSRSVPRRFFQPPMWLRSIDVSPGTACDGYANFRQTMFRFIGILRTREMVMYRNMMLADEWSRAVNGPDFLLAGVLEASSFQSWLLTMYIWPYLETSLDYKDQVDKYMRENPSKHAVVIRKVLHGNIYRMIQARKRESRLEKERQEALRRESRLEEEEISSG